jgi:hypothetical protein
MKKTEMTYADVCKFHKVKPTDLPGVDKILPKFRNAVIAHYKIMLAVEAIRNGEPFDHANYEDMYYIWWALKASEEVPSGFGLSYYDYDSTSAGACVGPRLSVKTPEQIKVLANFRKEFEEYWFDIPENPTKSKNVKPSKKKTNAKT